MKNFAKVISFIAPLLVGIFQLGYMLIHMSSFKEDEYFYFILSTLLFFNLAYYVYLNDLTSAKSRELNRITKENDYLKELIEQNKLKKQLEELRSKKKQ